MATCNTTFTRSVTFFGPSRNVSSAFMPKKDKGFDKNDFMTAFGAYMQDQRDNNRGRRSEKEAFFKNVQQMFAAETVDMKKVYQAFEKVASSFSSWWSNRETVGEHVMKAWTEKFKEAYPDACKKVESYNGGSRSPVSGLGRGGC